MSSNNRVSKNLLKQNNAMEDITVKELKERLANKETLHIIDVREQHEYDEFNIGATLIPLGEIPNRLDELTAYENEELILHCRSGGRSGKANLANLSSWFLITPRYKNAKYCMASNTLIFENFKNALQEFLSTIIKFL